ncbi:MAG: hypothetical protein JSS81_05575 [Acidobacteria bacterium]|nr:hypothetical protein [Acidobacteriota bacterium]
MKNIIAALAFSLILFAAAQAQTDALAAPDSKTTDKTAAVSKFRVGQTWSYRTRPGEEDSYFIVLRVDADPKLGPIVHIALENLKIKNRRTRSGLVTRIAHLPFAESALEESAGKLLREKTALPDFRDGYDEWKKAFDDKRAGIYTASLDKVVEIIENGLNAEQPEN